MPAVALRRLLRGTPTVPADSSYAVERSLPHGYVEVVLGVMHQLGLDTLLAEDRKRTRGELHDAKAQPSETVPQKKPTKHTVDSWPVHSYQSLMDELTTRCKNICRVGEGKEAMCFTMLIEPMDFQRHVLDLLGLKCTKACTQ